MSEQRSSTRRGVLRAGVGAALGAPLAGCTGDSGESTADGGTTIETSTESTTETATETATATDRPATETATDTESDGTYTAEISPVGEVTFDSPPERVFAITTHYADMAFALGRGDDLTAVFAPEYNDSLMNAFGARLEGVTVDWTDLYGSWNPDKEKLYDLDCDVHLADPANVVAMESWDRSDVREIREEIAPWFGNSLSDQYRSPPSAYADEYEHYPLWEIFARVARALDERERYRELASIRDDLLSTIEDGLPPEDERPSVAMLLNSTSDDSMWVYDTTAKGFYAAHTRPMGASDAIAAQESVASGDQIDYEALLEADPDALLVLGGVVDVHDMPAIRDRLADDPVASEVAAVQNDRVYAQGTRHQGPILNLFQLEMTAKQLYPEQFGEWPAYETGPYPEIPADEQLLDHQRVADVIRGEF